MKNFYVITFVILTFLLIGCKVKKYPYNYVAYMFDSKLRLPSDKIELRFINDSTAYFLNHITKENVFKQKFIYNKSHLNFICVKKVDTINRNIISLKANDTIVFSKDKMCFLFRGNFTAPLCFKKDN